MRAFIIQKSDVDRCPIRSLHPGHYREGSTCYHVADPEATITGGHVAYPPPAYDPLETAVAEVRAGRLTLGAAAARYGVNRWILRRRVAGQPT